MVTQTTNEYLVPKELHGARVDKAALTLVTNVSRAQMKRAIADGAVREPTAQETSHRTGA